MDRTSSAGADRLARLVRAAEMHFIQGAPQQEIARALGVSPATVSRMLREARELGIVEIRIHDPATTRDDLQDQLSARFGLVGARVVAGAFRSQAALRQALARHAARWLLDRLAAAPVRILGMSWGRTMLETVTAIEELQSMSPTGSGSGSASSPREDRAGTPMEVVPLLGGLGQVAPELQINDLVARLAKAVGARPLFLHAPAVVAHEATRETLLKDPSIAGVLALWDRLELAVVGVGPEVARSPMLSTGYYRDDEVGELIRLGAVGDIAGRFFGPDGNEVPASSHRRLIAVAFEQLKRAPLRLAVAGGPWKVRAILGALRAGLVNVMVTDEQTARALLDEASAGAMGA